MGWFVEVYRRRDLKVNAGKSKVMLRNGVERLECEVHADWIRFEGASKFKYLGCTDRAEYSRKVDSGRRVVDAIRYLVNARDLHLQCVRVKHEKLSIPVFMYGSETMLWKEIS